MIHPNHKEINGPDLVVYRAVARMILGQNAQVFCAGESVCKMYYSCIITKYIKVLCSEHTP